MGRGNLLVFFQLFFSIYSGNTKKEEIYSPSGAIPGFHLLLYQNPWISPCGNRYAEVFQGLSTFYTPDDTHTGEEGTDRENTWSGTINIRVGAT
jgi:hypothetical protein